MFGGVLLGASPSLVVPVEVARRFLLGRSGLWPGRRLAGKEGTARAIRLLGQVQVDPVSVIAKSHDLTLFNRVEGYEEGYLDELLYQDRAFFDFGGHLDIYPMEELPYWRLHMRRRLDDKRVKATLSEHADLATSLLAAIGAGGPAGSSAFKGEVVGSYRAHRDSGAVLYMLWLTGSLMTHSRKGTERIYDLLDRVAPAEHRHSVADVEAEAFFARTSLRRAALQNLTRFRQTFAYQACRVVPPEEGRRLADDLVSSGDAVWVEIEGAKGLRLLPAGDAPLLEALLSHDVPAAWAPLQPEAPVEAAFLSPLDAAIDRDYLKDLFAFEYVWEIYKRPEDVVYGRYATPILLGDRLVGRMSPRLDRKAKRLVIEGLWTEEESTLADPRFVEAVARGLARLSAFLRAETVDLSAVNPGAPRKDLEASLRQVR